MPRCTRLAGALGLSLVLHAALLLVLGMTRSKPSAQIPDANYFRGRTLDVEAALEPRAASEMSRARQPPSARAVPPEHAEAAESAVSAHAARAVGIAAPAHPEPVRRDSSAADSRASAEFGAEGLQAGVRRLAPAFTRAIPAAVSRDAAWSTLPLGALEGLRIAIALDEQGRIVTPRVLAPKSVPDVLQRLVDRTVLLLKSGRFALSRTRGGAQTEVLGIRAEISMQQPTEGFSPEQPVRLGFEPPAAGRSGKAFFSLASGRHVEISVSIE